MKSTKLQFKIRKFEKKDEEQVLEMFEEFGEYFVEIDNLKRQRVAGNYAEYYFEEMIKEASGRDGLILVAEVGDKVMGFAAGKVVELTPGEAVETFPCIKGRILELFVRNDFRGHGLGGELVGLLEKFFKKQGCELVNVEVFVPNKLARGFYGKLGYAERNLDLIKLLK